MRGRTNVGGGGEFLVDGNVISGIVDEPGGIVTGDFVERTVTLKHIDCATIPNNVNISGNFGLSDGRFCAFFAAGSSLKTSFRVWFFKIEDNQMVDLGTYNIQFPGEISFYEKIFMIKMISENTFIFSTRGSSGKTFYFYTISVSGTSIEVKYVGNKSFDSVKTLLDLVKYSQNKVLAVSKDSNDILFYTIDISGESAVFGDELNANVSVTGLYYKSSVVYEDQDGKIALFYNYGSASHYACKVILLSITGAGVSILKNESIWEDVTSEFYVSDASYIGNSRILIAKFLYSNTHTFGNILTLTESTLSISAEIDMGNSPYYPGAGLTKLYNDEEHIFLVTGKYGTGNSQTEYAIGVLDPDSIEAADMTIFYTGRSGSYGSYFLDLYSDSTQIIASAYSYYTQNNVSTMQYFRQIGLKVSGMNIESLESVQKFKKRISHIDGVAKQSGSPGDVIEVYVPK